MRGFGRDIWSEFSKWRCVIENRDAATMRGNGKIASAWMDLNIVDPHRRHIANTNPMRSLIERGKNSEVGAGVEQFWSYQIFTHHFHRRVRRQIACDRRPRFAEVTGAQNRRL